MLPVSPVFRFLERCSTDAAGPRLQGPHEIRAAFPKVIHKMSVGRKKERPDYIENKRLFGLTAACDQISQHLLFLQRGHRYFGAGFDDMQAGMARLAVD